MRLAADYFIAKTLKKERDDLSCAAKILLAQAFREFDPEKVTPATHISFSMPLVLAMGQPKLSGDIYHLYKKTGADEFLVVSIVPYGAEDQSCHYFVIGQKMQEDYSFERVESDPPYVSLSAFVENVEKHRTVEDYFMALLPHFPARRPSVRAEKYEPSFN